MPYPEHFGTDYGQYQNTNQTPYQPPGQAIPRYKIVFAHGEQGVNDFPMGPNSSIILGDDTDKQILWIVTTDDLGYKTKRKIKYTIESDTSDIKSDDINELKNEVKSLSEKVIRLEGMLNEQRSNGVRNGKSKPATDSES